MDKRYQYGYKSPIGTLYIIFDNQYLYGVHYQWVDNDQQNIIYIKEKGNHVVLNSVITQLEQYFKGTLKEFDLPILFESGTDFQKSVWKALDNIDYGKLVSYKDIAEAINNPKAVRAVGGANNKNPISVIIP